MNQKLPYIIPSYLTKLYNKLNYCFNDSIALTPKKCMI